MTARETQAVKSADRVLDLFELLARRGQALSHTEISAVLDIPKSSLTPLLRNLLARGYLAYAAEDRAYRLGEAFSRLVRQTARQRDLPAIAEPLLAEITRRTGESAALNVVEGREAKVVATVSSPQRLVSHLRLGDRAPLYATSGGKAMLAFFPPDALDDYLAEVPLRAITPRTIMSPAALRAQLDTIRIEKVADVFEELTPGIVGLAVPVLAADGDAIGAINVAMPAVRYDEDARARIVAALREAASALEHRLAIQ